MIVSRGLGSHTIPIRIFNPAELVRWNSPPRDGYAEREKQKMRKRLPPVLNPGLARQQPRRK